MKLARPAVPRPSRLALALGQAAVLLLASPLAQGTVYVNGSYNLDPSDATPLGPGDILKPTSRFNVGLGAYGSFSADSGSLVRLGFLTMGVGGTGWGDATITGAGTRLELTGDGNGNRLELGNYGNGHLYIMDGAVLDGRANAAACLSGNAWCNNFVGQAAGSYGSLSIHGAGSEARLLNSFGVAQFSLNPGWGTPGADTKGDVSVAYGGTLRTWNGTIARFNDSPLATGTEKAIGWATVDGAGSLWQVGSGAAGSGTTLELGVGARAQGYLQVFNGGLVLVDPGAGGYASVRVGDRGFGQVNIQNADSALVMMGDADKGSFDVGQNAGGVGTVWVGKGGLLRGAHWNNFGMNGGSGTLDVRDAGSVADFRNGVLFAGYGGSGTIRVLSGGKVQTQNLMLADLGGSASATLDGAGSLIELSGPANTSRLTVGQWGTASLVVSGGALLDGTLNAAACANSWCDSFIGAAAGSDALLRITGAGSEVRLLANMTIGGIGVATQAKDGWTHGVAGGASTARVEILDGGVLRNEQVGIGGSYSRSGNGGERSFAEVVVSGAGSLWSVTGNAARGWDAGLNLGTSRGAESRLSIAAGGRVAIAGEPGRGAWMDIGAGPWPMGGGKGWVSVEGEGSRLEIVGETQSRLVVGNASGGTGTLTVSNKGVVSQASSAGNSYLNIGETDGRGTVEILSGGRMEGARSVNVGSGGTGSLLIDGTGSLLTTQRVAGTNQGQLQVGTSGSGALTVRNGGQASAFTLGIGNGYGSESGSVLVDGAGSRVELDGIDWHRLGFSRGTLTVSGGGVLDATVNAAACAGHWCGTFLANNAGDDVRFTITGAGSKASFLSGFNVGMAYVTAPPENPWTLGRPGETSRVTLEVLNGGRLETEGARIAQGPSGGAATGAEGVQAKILISGAGSVWDVRAGPDDGGAASFVAGMGSGINTQSDIQIRAGGQLLLHADASHAAAINLGLFGGQHSLLVSGAGSLLSYSDNNNAGFWVGRNGAQASLKVLDGGQIQGINRLQIGNTGASGQLSVDGAGSAIQYGAAFADLYVGRQGGFGSATVTRGARIDLQGDAFSRLYVADGTGSDTAVGTLRIDGAGSAVALQSAAFAAGSGHANPTGQIGWGGTGTVQISNGGQLTLLGQGASTLASPASTRLTIGQAINGITGVGTVNVSGAGSLLSVTGTDAIVYVGRSGGFGTVSLSNGGELRTTVLDIGAQGATGNLNVSAGKVALSGQWASSELGAIMAVGFGGGSLGSVFLGNGSTLTISNMGTAGAGLLLGGINQSPRGSGSLSVMNNSHVSIEGPAGANAFIVGLGGSGLATFDSGSSLTIANGDVYIGRDAEGVGTLKVLGGSTLTAAYVGVGSTQAGDGGVGTLIVNDSVLSAGLLEIGARGYVGGNGTLAANVLNRGVFNPGNSPGTLTIAGSFTNAAGGRLVLEVQGDGHGGFVTDQLVFADGAAVDFSGLKISFQFLGSTDPAAFQASGGFEIDKFFALQGGGELDHSKFSTVSFSASADSYAISNFTFNPDTGANFVSAPVPEAPPGWQLMAGLLVLGWLRARRKAVRRCE